MTFTLAWKGDIMAEEKEKKKETKKKDTKILYRITSKGKKELLKGLKELRKIENKIEKG